jgi:branched-chain amino acid transport system permease protein
MQNYLSGFGEWVLVIQGVIFVTTVMLFRRGVVGEIAALASRLMRASDAGTTAAPTTEKATAASTQST